MWAAYESVVRTYGATRLDMDVEDRSLENLAGIDRRNKALRRVEAWAARTGRRLQIEYTLPVEPPGLESNGLHVLRNAIRNGTRVDVVNIMTFDYYDGVTTDMGAAAISAARGLHHQLHVLYPRRGSRRLWAMEGNTILPGIDDYPRKTEVTTLADAASRTVVCALGRHQHHLDVGNRARPRHLPGPDRLQHVLGHHPARLGVQPPARAVHEQMSGGGLRVVGAGLGRTGTHSLMLALEQLLGGRCYHMAEVIERPNDVPVWHAAIRGEQPDWRTFLAEYEATVDWPACAFWRELDAANPRAIVLLSVRESPEVWWKSFEATIAAGLAKPVPADEPDWAMRRRMVVELLDVTFASGWRQRYEAIAAYEAHNAAVRAAVHPSDWSSGGRLTAGGRCAPRLTFQSPLSRSRGRTRPRSSGPASTPRTPKSPAPTPDLPATPARQLRPGRCDGTWHRLRRRRRP